MKFKVIINEIFDVVIPDNTLNSTDNKSVLGIISKKLLLVIEKEKHYLKRVKIQF